MKKGLLKKLLSLTMVLSIISTSFIVVSADSGEINEDLFSQFVVPIFQQNKNYSVLSQNGDDETEKFIKDTETYYINNDYKSVKHYIASNNFIVEKNLQPNENLRIYSNTYYVERYAVVRGYGVSTITGASSSDEGEITWSISGSASCDKNYNITAYSSPSFYRESGIIGWSGTSVSCWVDNLGKSIRVNYRFRATWTKGVNGIYQTTYTSDFISGSFGYAPLA